MSAFTVGLFILATIILLESGISAKSKSRFTDLRCESYNQSIVQFEKCRLKLIGRGVVGVNVHVNMLQKPVTDIFVNWSFWRRYNGYQPFLYNVTCDLCQLLAHPRWLSFEGLVLGAISSRSNLNHSCPINHDVIVDNLVFTDAFLKSLPLPQGTYKLKLRFSSYQVWTMQVEVVIYRDE